MGENFIQRTRRTHRRFPNKLSNLARDLDTLGQEETQAHRDQQVIAELRVRRPRADLGAVIKIIAHLQICRDAVAQEKTRAHSNQDRKSTRLNSSHVRISYAVFCLKKKKQTDTRIL